MSDLVNRIGVIEEKNYINLMTAQVEPYLEKKRREGVILSSDNRELHYEAYEKTLSKGSIVILHGFTESAEKFREMSYYFRKAGYSVFVPDLRGHGKSYHASEKTERVEIDSFDSYADDLDIFIGKVVRPASGDKDIFLYSHSLGSTVALLYMIQHNHTVRKAVLSSPMICGNMGMPVIIAGTVAKLLCAFGGKKISAPGRCVFDPDQSFENSDATSKARFEYYHEKRKNESLYQTSGPSFGWVKASLEARDKILSADAVRNLNTELLLFKPEEDRQLLSEYTEKFAALADVKIKKVRNSKHEIFMSNDEVIEWYVEKILKFFAED